VVDVAEAARELHALTRSFLALRGEGPTAAWHVDELDRPLLPVLDVRQVPDAPADADRPEPPLGRLRQRDGRFVDHLAVPEGRLTPALRDEVLGRAGDEVVVTPWRSVLLPDLEAR
jgi:precorrin-3B synthase